MSIITEKFKTLRDLITAELRFVGNWTKVSQDTKHDRTGYFPIKHSCDCINESIHYIRQVLPYLDVATRLGKKGDKQYAQSATEMSNFVNQILTNMSKLIVDTTRRINSSKDVVDQIVDTAQFGGYTIHIADYIMELQNDVIDIANGKYKSNVKIEDLPTLDSVIHVMNTSTVNGTKGMKLFEQEYEQKQQHQVSNKR